MNFNKFTKLWQILLVLPLIIAVSCSEDDDPAADPVASFQSAPDAENYLKINFTNASSGAATYSWDFGDNSDASSEENPSHTYAAVGDYVVVLTATNVDGVDDTFEATVAVVDPLESQRVLVGENGKTWQFIEDGIPYEIQPTDNSQFWWAFGVTSELCNRPCIFDDTWTFNTDGTYTYDNNGDFWKEASIWGVEECGDATDASLWTVDGNDLSDWDSGTHEFEYDFDNQKLKVIGGFVGKMNVTELGDALVPAESVTYDVIKLVDADVDTLVIQGYVEDANSPTGLAYWRSTLVSYDNPADDIITIEDCPGCELPVLSAATMGHTFASADGADQLGSIGGASTIALGVDDPTDPAATKVGKFTRVAGGDYQEAQIRVSPDPKDFDLSGMSTISLDVYFPSSNDYTGTLTKVVALGFADQSCVGEWWTDLNQWVSDGTHAEDTWITFTYNLDDADAGNPKARAGLDMLFINIGSGGHPAGGDFYIRNLEVK